MFANGFSRQDFKLGMKVIFGRGNGEQTLGKIKKLNPTKAKVETLEERGNGRGSGVGAVWTVPYSLMRPADQDAKPGVYHAPPPPAPKPPLTYNSFAGEDNLILEAIVGVHNHLSPENLSCDGEASLSHIRRMQSELGRKLRGLQAALGREVDEGEAYEWLESKRKYEAERKKAV